VRAGSFSRKRIWGCCCDGEAVEESEEGVDEEEGCDGAMAGFS